MASAKLPNKLSKFDEFLTATDKHFFEILFYCYPHPYRLNFFFTKLPRSCRHFQANFQIAVGNGSMQKNIGKAKMTNCSKFRVGNIGHACYFTTWRLAFKLLS